MTAPASGDGLKRQLGLLDATMINVGTIIASAIFLVPAAIAQQVHVTSLMIGVWVVGGLVSLLGALCVAELGAALPEAGGTFVYLREAYGPVWGYLYGWANAIVINPASIAAIAVGFATYAGHFTPLGDAGIKLVAVASIVVLTVINCIGVRLGATTQDVLTLLKVGIVVFLIVACLALPGGSTANFHPFWPAERAGSIVAPLGTAMIAVLWAYDGWIESSYVGSEIKDPGRNLPRSIIWSTLIATVLYTAITIAYLRVLSPAATAASKEVASDAAKVVLGAGGAALVAAAILVSTLGANNGIVLTAARIPYAMARDGVMFRAIGRVHPRLGTPVWSLVTQGLVAVALTLTGSYDQLFTYVIFTEWLFYAMACAGVIRLRQSRPDLARPYRAWGYPVTPMVFVAFATWLMGNTIVEQPRESLVGVVLLVAGLPLYWYWRRMVGRKP